MQQKKSISAPKAGMNKDVHPSQLKPTEYSFLLNGRTETETGDLLSISNEPSNRLSVIFPEGYKVIGYERDHIRNRTYYLLTNPLTKLSSVGYVDNTQLDETFTDTYVECEECDYNHNQLGTPLEDTVQAPSHSYIELFNDNCDGSLNFDINFPIKYIEIKQEKLGTNLYWNDKKNPPRWFNTDDITYLFTEDIPCEDDEVGTCLIADKLLQFPKHTRIHINPEKIQTGGNLKFGTYEFYAAYCDAAGNEYTSYSTPTNPVSIFDENNNILSQTTLDSFSNFAIRLKVENLDKNFLYYKIVCIERNNVNNTQSAFVEGIHPTTDDTILYTSSGSISDEQYIFNGNARILRRIDIQELFKVKPHYEWATGLMASGKRLFQWGMKARQEVNLQPVVNLFSPLLKWQSSVANEDLYKSGIASSKYRGYMRNEVQPLSVRLNFKDGDYTANFPMVGRPANEVDREIISPTDPNRLSLEDNTPNCTGSDREQRWQIFNTATQEGICTDFTGDGIVVEETVQRTCFIEDVFTIPAGSVTVEIEDNYSDLPSYIEDHPDQDIPGITEYLNDDYPDDHCEPNFGNADCGEPELIDTYNQIGEIFYRKAAATLTGTSGTANIRIEGVNYLATFNTSLTQTADDFVSLHAATILATHSLVVINNSGTLIFSGSNDNNYAIIVVPVGGDLNGTVVLSEGSGETFNEKSVEEYTKSVPTELCRPYKMDSQGDEIRDEEFETAFMPSGDQVYKRDSSFNNEGCAYAEDVVNNNNPLEGGIGFFQNYHGSLVLADLLQSQDALATDADFQNKLHKGALWYKINRNNRTKFVFEITKNSECEGGGDDIPETDKLRFHFYKTCGNPTPIYGEIVQTDTGTLILIDLEDYPPNTFPNSFYVAIDAPIKQVVNQSAQTAYIVSPPCGCYSPYTRDIEYNDVTVTWESIIINKAEVYQSTCKFIIPKVSDCDPEPYAYGKFSYWESTVTYPDNNQLYDSSNLLISEEDLSDLTETDKDEWEQYFTNGLSGNNYNLTAATNLVCQPIRHFKFPDNNVSPSIIDTNSPAFTDALIFPLGVMFDDGVVLTMLKVAVKNGYLTEEQFLNIDSYEILRGDNSVHKSVIANGLAYDMYQYNKKGKTHLYSNYPHNDLGRDMLHLDEETDEIIEHPYGGDRNKYYSFISPDIFLTNPALPNEVVFSGYQLGNSRARFERVDNHPKWTILGRDAYDAAERLAFAEATLEQLIKVAELSSQFWITVGVSSGTALGAIIGAIVAAVAYEAQRFMTTGKYRYEWLKIFRDLGVAYNFANYAISYGFHNNFVKNLNPEQYIRGLAVRKYMKDGRYNFRDTNSGIELKVNNWQREYAAFLSLGEHFFDYSQEYIGYDNNSFSQEAGSRTIASQNDCEINTDSIRSVGSPYFTLKNYVPDQFGEIDSIKWLTTNSVFKLNESSKCKPVFGGTVYISRFTWKRKLPIFTSTAMDTADRVAFNYKELKNIGKPVYYCNYESDSVKNIIGIPFPDIGSDFKFDCQTGANGMYVKPPSKMYLYYYGITDFLVESEINCNFRYAGRELKDQFYPQVGDITDWTQEKNLSIKVPNSFYYNNTYSLPTSNTPYKMLDSTYDEERWRKLSYQKNAVIYSQVDNSESDFVDPWRIYKPLDYYNFETKFGNLIDLVDLGSEVVLGRFTDEYAIFNSIDTLAEKINPQGSDILGTGGIFARRPITLGQGGTQHSEYLPTPFGDMSVDAKRGRVMLFDKGGKQLSIISDQVGQEPSGMRNWFREHLPFKILQQFPQADIDNKYKGIGLSAGWDSRFNRMFLTKRDYVAKNLDCLKYEDGLGFYTDCNNDCSDGLDIVFILDATASQQGAINNIKDAIETSIVPAIVESFGTDYRLGLVAVYDRRTAGQALFDIMEPMTTTNSSTFLVQLESITATGGVGAAEPTDLALRAVLDNSVSIDMMGNDVGSITIGTFRPNAAKAVILVTDQLPSGLDDTYEMTDWIYSDALADECAEIGIQIFPILTAFTEATPIPPSITPPNVTYLMQNYAEKTNGQYYFASLGEGISDNIVDAIENNIVCEDVKIPVDFDDTEFFEDVSWTVDFKVGAKWESHWSWFPDYYVNNDGFFQTGNNYGELKEEMYSHMMQNSNSYQVFGKRLHPFTLDFPISNENVNKYLNSIELEVEAKRYQNRWDYAVNREVGFNKAVIYNSTNNSGLLNLQLQKTLNDANKNKGSEVYFTSLEGKHIFNYFYNRVRNDRNNIPQWLWDKNMINKAINPLAVSFKGKSLLERLRGQYFNVRLTQDKESRYAITLNKSINDETIYE